MSAQIEITNITGTYPVDVYVADAFGNNSSFLGTIVNALSLPQLYTLPAVFNSAPSVMVTLIDANGCEEFKILECLPVFPTPSVTPSVTSSLAVTPSVTPSISISVTPSVSNTPSISISSTPSVTPSISISVTPSVSNTPSISISSTPSVTPSISISATPSISVTPSISNTPSISITPSPSPIGYLAVSYDAEFCSFASFTAKEGASLKVAFSHVGGAPPATGSSGVTVTIGSMINFETSAGAASGSGCVGSGFTESRVVVILNGTTVIDNIYLSGNPVSYSYTKSAGTDTIIVSMTAI